ncbi:MAG: tyrosine-type recombinase/integrase [Nocardioides sp.]
MRNHTMSRRSIPMPKVISADTTVSQLVEYWLQLLRTEARLELTTINEYERVLRKLVVPTLGPLTMVELRSSHIDAVLTELGTRSVNRQRKARVVTGAMLDVAVRRGALAANPVRGSISVPRPKVEHRAVTREDLDRIRAAVQAWAGRGGPGPKASGDMSDIVDLLLATGARIGEVLAIRWSDVELERGQARISGTVKTEPGRGTHRKPLPEGRTVRLPRFAVEVLRRRLAERRDMSADAVFPTRNGTWQQVNNVERRWRQIREGADLRWVTPDALRGLLASADALL